MCLVISHNHLKTSSRHTPQQLRFSRLPYEEGKKSKQVYSESILWQGHKHSVQVPGTCPRWQGRNTALWHQYTGFFAPLRHGYLCNSGMPTVTPQGLVQYMLTEQPHRSIWNALPLPFQVESIRLEKLKLVFQMQELKQHHSRVRRFPSFKAEQGKKAFALQSLHVIWTAAEHLHFIWVKWTSSEEAY